MKMIGSIISIIIGFLIFALWVAGSSGHLRFPPKTVENWIIIILITVCFFIPIFLFVNGNKKKR